jgi:opacity protein-like surface antigen
MYTTLNGSGDLSLNTQPFNAPFDKDWTSRNISVDQDSHVVNLNSMFGPFAALTLCVGLQAEHTSGEGRTVATLTELGAGGVTNSPAALIHSSTDKNSLEESIGARYIKIPFTTLYAEGRWTEQQIDLNESETLDAVPDFTRKTDTDSFRQDYTVGFNTAPIPRVTLSGRYRHSIYENDYGNHVDTMPGYPAFITQQNFVEDEFATKLTLRPCRYFNVAFKYQKLATNIKMATDSVPLLAPGGGLQSGNYDANIYSVSAMVTPLSRLYVTGLFSLQDTRTSTFANHNPAVATYVGDVYTVMGVAGYALDNKTDVTVEYSYSRTDNFNNNSADGLPLGLDSQRTGLLVGLARRISNNMIARVRYGYYNYDDRSGGGIDNYIAHLASASCIVRF